MNYFFHILFLLGIYVILTVSLDILVGHLGLLVLCHSAFFAVGAYVSAYAMLNAGWPFVMAACLGVLATVMFSIPVALTAMRLRGDAIVLGSFSLLLITVDLLKNLRGITGGLDGLRDIPPMRLGVWSITSIPAQAIFVVLVAVVCWLSIGRITCSAQRYFLHALRDDPHAAVGLRAFSASLYLRSFALASGVAGLAGAFYATYMTYINPNVFGADQAITLTTMVLIGGASKPLGPILGAAVVLSIPEFVRTLGGGSAEVGAMNYAVMGIVLILFAAFRPRGILGGYEFK